MLGRYLGLRRQCGIGVKGIDPGFKSQYFPLSGYVVLGKILHPSYLCFPICEMG